MAAVSFDLADLVPDLELTLQAPGSDDYANVSEEEWIGRLRNGFWAAFLDGLLVNYTEEDGIVKPRGTGAMITRDLQQLIIMYTGIDVLRQRLLGLQTVFRAKAGPVEYEVQQSAQVAKALLDDLSQRRIYILERLAETGVARSVIYIDSYASRQAALNEGYTRWVGN